MEKIIAGQKVVRIAKDQESGFFNAKCLSAGIDPKSALTVTSVSGNGKWLGLDGLTVEGESHLWKRSNFEPFIEPAEASPAVVFTRPETQKADADGWIEWPGGECPVGGDVLVDFRMRDGAGEVHTYSDPGHLLWSHTGGDGDIVAYRPRVKEKTEEQKLLDRVDILESGYNEEINKRINAEREASEKIAKLESQLNDELHNRISRENLIARLRVILGENGREFKALKAEREEIKTLHREMAIEIASCNQVIANHSKLMQAQEVVIEQSRDNVKLALVLAASPEVSGDAVESMARLARIDQRCQDEKIVKLMNDRYVVDLPF